jgi:5-methylcytosine-specific restriction enzyme subunit McrC
MWEPAGRLAELINRLGSVRDDIGDVQASSFTVDMNLLFERFVQRVVERVARDNGWSLEAQARRRLTSSVTMKPDLVLRNAGVDRAVGDAKYKELAPDGWPHADLYQLLAYCVGLGLEEGVLVYGEADRSRRELVRNAGIALEIVGVDLSRPPAHVLASTRAAALRLVKQAQRNVSRSLAAA